MDQEKRALITGITGQDGVYLSRELAAHGRNVVGLSRQTGSSACRAVDYHDRKALWRILEEVRPQEIYHLASPSCVQDTAEFESEILAMSGDVTALFLRWIADSSPATRFFFASSSEVFGDPTVSPQDETTPANPAHPYAFAKLTGQNFVKYFREQKSIFACSGILYNHESPLRRSDFVSRRITAGVAEIVQGRSRRIELGNLDAVRDWTHAQDFARAMRLTLEADQPGDYVLASGHGRTVRDFCRVAFAAASLDFEDYLFTNESFHRADFQNPRIGNPAKARQLLGWEPQISFEEMVNEMVAQDLAKP